jgi:hypothetical protein
MRILVIASAALLTQASYAAPAPPAAPAVAKPQPFAHRECRRTTSYNADSAWRDGELKPRKLTELPPATTYMAVYRTVNGCEKPLTMTEYRRSAR